MLDDLPFTMENDLRYISLFASSWFDFWHHSCLFGQLKTVNAA